MKDALINAYAGFSLIFFTLVVIFFLTGLTFKTVFKWIPKIIFEIRFRLGNRKK